MKKFWLFLVMALAIIAFGLDPGVATSSDNSGVAFYGNTDLAAPGAVMNTTAELTLANDPPSVVAIASSAGYTLSNTKLSVSETNSLSPASGLSFGSAIFYSAATYHDLLRQSVTDDDAATIPGRRALAMIATSPADDLSYGRFA